jgi:hypothetical protein
MRPSRQPTTQQLLPPPQKLPHLRIFRQAASHGPY